MKRSLPKASFWCEAPLSYQENEGICYENCVGDTAVV